MARENKGDSKNRYRISNDNIVKKLGIKPNKNRRYRLTDQQKAEYFNLDIGGINRLFFDIETSPYLGYFWSLYPKSISYDMIEEPMKVICISYKWEHEEQIRRLEWNKGCDKKMIEKFVKVMNKADEIIAHNGDRYDVRVLRTRAIFHRIPMMPKYRTLDTLKKSRSGFRFPSNRLDAIAKYLGVNPKVSHEGWSMWERTVKGDVEALKEMGNYCDGDIVTLEDVYFAMQNYIKPNTHVGVHNEKLKASCPSCGSEDIGLLKNIFTPSGTIKRLMECNTCSHNYEISNRSWRTFLEMKSNQLI